MRYYSYLNKLGLNIKKTHEETDVNGDDLPKKKYATKRTKTNSHEGLNKKKRKGKTDISNNLFTPISLNNV